MADWPYSTAAWRKLRLAKLAGEPLCQPCKARDVLTSANTVDHIKPIADGGDPFPPFAGLMSMCGRCHNEKTAANDRGSVKPFARKIKGVDVNGNPVDPGDGWHGGVTNSVGALEKKILRGKSAAGKNGRAQWELPGGGQANHRKNPPCGPVGENEIYLVSALTNAPAEEDGFA